MRLRISLPTDRLEAASLLDSCFARLEAVRFHDVPTDDWATVRIFRSR
jgi:hypothetical protein